jgi:hypothetical protein
LGNLTYNYLIEFEENYMLNPILDLFSGADGGIAFVELRGFIEALEKQNDPSSAEILARIKGFSNLCQHVLDGGLRDGNG